jgi:hypothetical protein
LARRRPRLEVEILERRCLPAVTATLTPVLPTGTASLLTITDTDTTGHTIAVTQTASLGTYTVTVDGVPLSGSPFHFVTAVAVNTGSDKDTLDFSGSPTGGPALTGNLSVTGTAGLTVDMGGSFGVLGTVTISDTGPRTHLVVAAAYGPSLGSTTITGGDGGTTVSMHDVTITGNATLALGNGRNQVVLGPAATGDLGVNVSGTLSVTGGVGCDSVGLVQSKTGAVTLALGNGKNVVGIATTTVAGDLALTAGTRSDSLAVVNSTIDGGLSATGSGAEALVLGGSDLVGGSVSADYSASRSSSVLMSGGKSTIDGSLTVAGGAGHNQVTLTEAAQLGQGITLALGSGTSSVVLTGLELGGPLVVSGGGALTVQVQGVSTLGDVSVIDTSSTVGLDVVLFEVKVSGSVTITSSQDTGGDLVGVDALAITGNLSITTGAGNDTVSVAGFSFIGKQSWVSGQAAISTGDGNDTITIDDADFVGAVTVNTGNGNNALTVETGTLTPYPSGSDSVPLDHFGSKFRGPVNVLMGTGNDTVVLGAGPTDEAIFESTVVLSGGGGSNTLTHAFAVFSGGTPTITGF